MYKRMYPTRTCSPKFDGLSKIHKKDTPLRPIVSSRDSVTYRVAKELAIILQALVGRSKQHIQNTQNLIEKIKDIDYNQGNA